MSKHMSKGLLALLLLALVVAVAVVGGPRTAEAGGDGLAKAIAAQERHTGALMARAGVAGTAVGLGDDGSPVVVIFTETPGIGGLPSQVDGVRTSVRVSGRFVALKPDKPEGSNNKNKVPTVTILAPANGENFPTDASVDFSGTASDKEEGDLTSSIKWTVNGTAAGTGGSGSTEELGDGTYVFAASVTDSGGKTGSASVTITVGTTPAPTPTPIPTPGPEPIDPTARFDHPVPIGVSTGHPAITAGTIGARVTNGTNVYALSNNHVYADENLATIGDNVLQPGAYDGGVGPADAIGTLFAYVPIKFDGSNNVVDAAIALSSTASLDNATPADGYGMPSATTAPAEIGLAVQKYGRTTGLTTGSVTLINATVNVGYDSGTALFVGQILVQDKVLGRVDGFSAGGDSGSLIVTEDGNNPVALLFAGSKFYTVANPIGEVLGAFGVEIDGE